MAGGDHDAGRGVQVPDREREQRRGLLWRQQVHGDARAGQHRGGLGGERRGPVPGVAPDDHPGGGRPRLVRGQPLGQRRGRGADHGPVHPVRPGRDRAAQPGRAELEPPAEPVRQLRPGRLAPVRQQPAQLGLVPGIRVVGDPRLHLVPEGGPAGLAR